MVGVLAQVWIVWDEWKSSTLASHLSSVYTISLPSRLLKQSLAEPRAAWFILQCIVTDLGLVLKHMARESFTDLDSHTVPWLLWLALPPALPPAPRCEPTNTETNLH